jgi:hypothetical protein
MPFEVRALRKKGDAGMAREVVFDETDRIVVVRVSGTATLQDHLVAREGALRMCQEKQCPRILVDLRELDTSGGSTVEYFDFGKSFPETSPLVRLAHVLPGETRSRSDVVFAATVEANRGRLAAVFDTVEDARDWLLR